MKADTTSGKSRPASKAKTTRSGKAKQQQVKWPAQDLAPQSDSSLVRPIGEVASATDTASPKQAGGFVLPVAEKVKNLFDNFNSGPEMPTQGLRPIFVYSHTHLGFAQMFLRRFGHHIRYDNESGQWITWDVRKDRWVTGRSANNVIMRIVKKAVTELYGFAKTHHSLRTRNGETVTPEKALAWAKSASQKSCQKAMLEMVRDFPDVRVAKAELDSDPCLLGVANGGALAQHIDDQAFHEQGEAPFGLGPRHFDLKHAVLRAFHARDSGMEEGLELAGIEVTPCSRLGMIPTSQLAATGRTAPSDTDSMLNMDIHPASCRVQFDVGNKPRVAQPQNPRIQVRVLHARPLGLTIIGHLPTEKSEGPMRHSRRRKPGSSHSVLKYETTTQFLEVSEFRFSGLFRA
jgi:hypothetical protein